jgi:hypothetical protein
MCEGGRWVPRIPVWQEAAVYRPGGSRVAIIDLDYDGRRFKIISSYTENLMVGQPLLLFPDISDTQTFININLSRIKYPDEAGENPEYLFVAADDEDWDKTPIVSTEVS